MAALLRVIDTLEAEGDDAPADVRAQLEGFVAQARERREALSAQLAMADEFVELLTSR